ncbi:MAG: hypothetical protein DRH21_01095 [Deltaproteobacteria bacterium]|nr:MAG: hypothetical protein DRH21_01095 [Deltaproteobacteria bacterium]
MIFLIKQNYKGSFQDCAAWIMMEFSTVGSGFIAMVTDIAVVYKLFRHNPDGPPRHNDFFSGDSVEIKDPDKLMKELAELTSSAENPTEKLRIALSHSENTAKKTLPHVFIYF